MSLPLVLFVTLMAQSATNAPPAPAASPIPELKEVAPGIFEYHGVRLDKKNQRISFPAVINQRVGLIEYALVNGKGKTHESLLSTNLMPRDIHLGMILIGYKEDAKANDQEHVPPSAIDSAYLQSAPKLKGPSVRLTVSWTINGQKKEVPIEDCILNLQTNKPMSRAAWTYNGSMIEDGAFLADQELSFFAVVTDPTALVNNPRPGYDNDQIWQLREDVIPALDTPVEVSITLLPPGQTMNRTRTTDLYFAEARSKLIDLAAFLDRIDRSEGADDFRLKSFRAALHELANPGPDKAKKILLLLSDPTVEPIAEAGAQSASGAWPGF